VAVRLAEHFDGEIVSVDSMQVYRGMDIGTAKPTMLERRGIEHHLVDVAEPEEEFSVASFRRLGREVLTGTEAPVMIITGGSGLHFRALVDPMSFAPTDGPLRAALETRETEGLVEELLSADPEAGAHVDLANRRRVVRAIEIHLLTGETPSSRSQSAHAEDVRRYVPEIDFEAVGVDPGGDLEERVDQRLSSMRRGGLVDEVRSLSPRLGRTARNAVGYREILDALAGDVSVDTWFQRDPRIRWIPWIEDIEQRTRRVLESLE
jgi:tRNA dimethylallyltransferase